MAVDDIESDTELLIGYLDSDMEADEEELTAPDGGGPLTPGESAPGRTGTLSSDPASGSGGKQGWRVTAAEPS